MTNEKTIIEAVLDEPILLATIQAESKWWERLLKRKPKVHDIFIKGATAATMFKITELLLSIKQKSDIKDDEGKVYDLMHSNVSYIVNFLAIAIHNAKGNPPPILIDMLNNNFTIEQLQAMASVAYRRLGIEPFFGIMGLLRSPDLKMEVTPEAKALTPPSKDL